jgi:hypothetical protein
LKWIIPKQSNVSIAPERALLNCVYISSPA